MPPASPPAPPKNVRRVSAVVTAGPGDIVTVTHMDLAIFCHMLHRQGRIKMPVEDVIKLSWGRHEFVFRDPGAKIRDVEVELANNPSIRLADWQAAERSLKTVMRSLIPQPWRKPGEGDSSDARHPARGSFK